MHFRCRFDERSLRLRCRHDGSPPPPGCGYVAAGKSRRAQAQMTMPMRSSIAPATSCGKAFTDRPSEENISLSPPVRNIRMMILKVNTDFHLAWLAVDPE